MHSGIFNGRGHNRGMKRAADGTLLVQLVEGGATQPVEITGQPIDTVQLATDPLGVEKKAPMSGILFTTTTPINTGITYDSGVLDVRNYQQVQTHVSASHNGSMQFIFCSDALGANIVRSITVPYTASEGFKLFSAPCFSDYVQYKFTNDSGTNQTSFLFETKVLTNALSGQVLDMTSFISPAMTSALTRSVIVAQNAAGTYSNIRSDQFNDLHIAIRNPLTAFGELRTAQFTPVAQYTFPYIINDRLWDASASTGSSTQTVANSMARLSTGTTTGSVSCLQSFKRAKYRAGQGIVARFTALFTTPGIAGTTQLVGFGDPEDGLFVGFDGTQFGVMRRSKASGSVVETWTYQSSFSLDQMDGTSTLPVIDVSKGNVYEITLQYLGYGLITFSCENPSTGRFIRFHEIQYANTASVPSMAVATLPAFISADNGATTSDIVVQSASMGLFSEGKVASTATTDAFSGEISGTTTEKPIFSLRAKTTFGAHENHVQTFLKYVNASMSSSGNRNCTVRLLRNPTLATPTWTDVATNSSQLEIDTTGTLTPGSGIELFTFTIASNASISTSLTDLDIFLSGGDILTVSGTMGSSTGTISASLDVLEDV